jgi:hypothetical protein
MTSPRWTATATLPVQEPFSALGRHASPNPDEPLYRALEAEWRRRGRMVPGDRDREWAETVVGRSRRGSVPDVA